VIETIAGIYGPLLGLLGRALVFPIGATAWLMREASRILFRLYQWLDDWFQSWIA
jgi:hypothetical protein